MSLDVYLLEDSERVYERNITHNVNKIAIEAGCYEPLWRPDEIGLSTAGELIEPLEKGLEALLADPARFERLNPSNGWGSYGGLLAFVACYLQACRKHPGALVEVSR